MFVISYLDEDGHRYDASSHSKLIDAEAQLERFKGSLNDLQIEEKDTFITKPWNLKN